MPLGFPVIPGWYLTPGIKSSLGGCLPMLPGGMLAVGGTAKFITIVVGWVAFTGKLPI
jgi:hypothetical protein